VDRTLSSQNHWLNSQIASGLWQERRQGVVYTGTISQPKIYYTHIYPIIHIWVFQVGVRHFPGLYFFQTKIKCMVCIVQIVSILTCLTLSSCTQIKKYIFTNIETSNKLKNIYLLILKRYKIYRTKFNVHVNQLQTDVVSGNNMSVNYNYACFVFVVGWLGGLTWEIVRGYADIFEDFTGNHNN
jgi:hypothetical protein